MEKGILKIKQARAKVLKKLSEKVGLLTLFLAATLAITPFQTALSAVAPSLGSAQSFAVLGSSTVTNTGSTIITGNLGIDPGSAVTGFPPGTLVAGTIYAADAVALQAQNDNLAAFNVLGSEACNTTYSTPTDIGGFTLVPGVYCFLSSAH